MVAPSDYSAAALSLGTWIGGGRREVTAFIWSHTMRHSSNILCGIGTKRGQYQSTADVFKVPPRHGEQDLLTMAARQTLLGVGLGDG